MKYRPLNNIGKKETKYLKKNYYSKSLKVCILLRTLTSVMRRLTVAHFWTKKLEKNRKRKKASSVCPLPLTLLIPFTFALSGKRQLTPHFSHQHSVAKQIPNYCDQNKTNKQHAEIATAHKVFLVASCDRIETKNILYNETCCSSLCLSFSFSKSAFDQCKSNFWTWRAGLSMGSCGTGKGLFFTFVVAGSNLGRLQQSSILHQK